MRIVTQSLHTYWNINNTDSFRRELKTTFSVVVRRWLGERDCTAQYNPATDSRRFCLFGLILYGAPAMSLTW